MIIKFEDYLLLLESLQENQLKKIKLFANVPEIYNWSINFSPKFSVWFANVIKNLLIEEYQDDKKNYDKVLRYLKGEEIISSDHFKPDAKTEIGENNADVFAFLTSIKNSIRKYTTNREYLNKYQSILDWLKSHP